jgi:hypothetical protein
LATIGDDWRACIAQVVGRHNARRREALRIEAPQLRPLPPWPEFAVVGHYFGRIWLRPIRQVIEVA